MTTADIESARCARHMRELGRHLAGAAVALGVLVGWWVCRALLVAAGWTAPV